MIEITLTKEEMQMAALVGVSRHWESSQRGHRAAHGLDPALSTVSLHIDGAMGEIAVAKALGRYWTPGVNTFKEADLGKRLQVRTCPQHGGSLIVRTDDRDDHAFTLVTGSAPCLRVMGWLWGREAKRPEWLKEHGGREPAWFVPAGELRALKTAQPLASSKERG